MALQKLAGSPQPLIRSPSELVQLTELDVGLWAASLAPKEAFSQHGDLLDELCEHGFLNPQKVCEVISWSLSVLQDLKWFFEPTEELNLNLLSDSKEGARLKIAAQGLLEQVGSKDQSLTYEAINSDLERLELKFSDGRLQLNEAQGDLLKLLTTITIVFSEASKKGVSLKLLEQFWNGMSKWTSWLNAAPQDSWLTTQTSKSIEGMQDAIDDFFKQVHLATGDSPLLFSTAQSSPLSLDKNGWYHPQHREQWLEFIALVLEPLSIEFLSWSQWEDIIEQHKEWLSWQKNRPQGQWDKVSIQYINNIIQQEDLLQKAKKRFEEESHIGEELHRARELKRLFLYKKGLLPILNTFVNFSYFYNPQVRSPLEAGSLLMEGVNHHLCIRTIGSNFNKQRASDSKIFLLYCEIDNNPEHEIMVGVLHGRKKNWFVGKKGLFTDREGIIHTATVTSIVEHPISIYEELLAPFTLLRQFINKQIANWSQRYEKEVHKGLHSIEEGGKSNLLMSGGIVFAALSSSLAYLIKTLSSISTLKLLSVLIAPMLLWILISGIKAGLELRKRDLSPILEANQWAMNVPLPVPSWSGPLFSRTPQLPSKWEHKDLLDQFQNKKDPWHLWKRRLLWIFWIIFSICLYTFWDDIQILWELLAPLTETQE